MESDDVVQQLLRARAAKAKLEEAMAQSEREAEERLRRSEARLRWAKGEILIALTRANPFDYHLDGGLDQVSDLEAQMWLRRYDEQH